MQQILVTQGQGIELLKEACKTNISAIQIREKSMEGGELYELASQLVIYAAPFGVQIFVNSRVDIAMAANATGVHLPEAGLSPAVAKKIAPQLIVGCSVHSKELALQKEAEGADYLYFGPIFETPGKAVPQGLDKLEEIVKAVSIPVIAIGGINAERAIECFKRGAKGIASIRDLSNFKHESRAF